MIEIGKAKTKQHDFSDRKVKSTHLELFQHLDRAPDSMRAPEKSLLVLATPRCGSTLFTQALNQSFRLGMCDEWFNYDYFGAYCKVTGKSFDLKEYSDFVTRKTVGGSGVLCVKLHIGQLVAMNQDFKIGIESMNFDHVVYLERRNKIAQAVSLCKATTSGKFRSYEPEESPPETSFVGIAIALGEITKFDQFAHKYLMGYVNARYFYEDFQTLGWNAHESYNATLQAMGASPCAHFSAGKLKRQADEQSLAATNGFRRYILGETP